MNKGKVASGCDWWGIVVALLVIVIPVLFVPEANVPKTVFLVCLFLVVVALSVLYVTNWGRGEQHFGIGEEGAWKSRTPPMPRLAAACCSMIVTALCVLVVGAYMVSKLPPPH